LFLTQVKGGGDAPSAGEQVSQCEPVASEMYDGVDAVGDHLPDMSGKIAAVVHQVMGTQLEYVIGLNAGCGGGDDRGAPSGGQLHHVATDTAGRTADENRLAGGQCNSIDGANRCGAGQTE
jgi:hypothetical protein